MGTEMLKKSFGSADQAQDVPQGRVELVTVNGTEVWRLILEPGWTWQASMGTESCPAHHAVFVPLSGRLAVKMADGTIEEFGPGDVGDIPPDHDAWVVGDETFVAVDIQGHSLARNAAA